MISIKKKDFYTILLKCEHFEEYKIYLSRHRSPSNVKKTKTSVLVIFSNLITSSNLEATAHGKKTQRLEYVSDKNLD